MDEPLIHAIAGPSRDVGCACPPAHEILAITAKGTNPLDGIFQKRVFPASLKISGKIKVDT